MKRTLYNSLPQPAQDIVRNSYYHLIGNPPAQTTPNDDFVKYHFDSRREYQQYAEEYRDGPALDIRADAKRQREQTAGTTQIGAVNRMVGEAYYALVRKYQPDYVVETGVGNGYSSLCLLLALDENDHGQLYSIDYPMELDEPIEEFRSETYDGYGGSAAIPPGSRPGWLIPQDYRDRWELHIGKSQRQLPQLLPELEEIDLFIHDSEHSLPCMHMEMELAYEFLSPDGLLVVDDIDWNDSFTEFITTRQPDAYGHIKPDVGWLQG